MDITRWSTLKSDWLYSLQPKMEKLYTVNKIETRPGADCGSDHELLITKFKLKLKKVGKTTRPFRYDLNQIPYDYTVEVRNRIKGLDLIDRVTDELWMEVSDCTLNFQMFKLVLEKTQEPKINLPTSTGSLKKHESSRKTSVSALLTMPKPLTVWITINRRKFLKRWVTRPPDLPLEKSVCRSGSYS